MRTIFTILLFSLLSPFTSSAQKKDDATKKPEKPVLLQSATYNGLFFRSIGPAVTSGRISDFAVNPANMAEYYVASSAGGVWKTVNAGTTYTPVFDGQGSYSIGCVALDPANPNVVSQGGFGENNNQRSASYGDGQKRERRKNVEKHGAEELRTHRQRGRGSLRPEHRLRGRLRPFVERRRRPRRI